MPEDKSESLEAVFDRHFDDVYGYVAYRLAPDLEAARDVTQEVFLAALRSWASYRGDGAVVSWLRAIARRKVADHLRLRGGRDCQVTRRSCRSWPTPTTSVLASVRSSWPK